MVALRQKRILAYDQHSDILRGKHRSATASGSDLPRTTPVCPTELQLQARLAHLATIQGVIGRMAGYSASVKTFTLTVSAALVAVAFDKELPVLFYAGFLIAAVFALLDAYYLTIEKSFRDLYAEVAGRDWSQAFDLSIRQRAVSLASVLTSVMSVSVWGFYLLLLASFAALPQIQSHVQRSDTATQQPSRNGPPAGGAVGAAPQRADERASVSALPAVAPERAGGPAHVVVAPARAKRPDSQPDR